MRQIAGRQPSTALHPFGAWELIVANQSIESKPASADPVLGETPLVSVTMVVYNEERFIARSLDQVLSQDYPNIEVIVIDGRSTDRTREIVQEYEARHANVHLVDNPKRFCATGMNLGILASKGEVITRVDGHCEVDKDFVRQGVELLQEHPEAWCVGGPTRHEGRNLVGKAVAMAMQHPAAVGGATHRFPNFEGYSDGVQFPAFRRWIFDRVGLFDEAMVRTEDDELSFRITQAGGKTYLSPRVRYKYYVRDTFGKLFQQYSQYAFWRIPVFRKHRRPTSVRQMVPLLFFTLMLALLVVGTVLRQPIVALALPALYLTALLAIGVTMIPRVGFKVACLVPLAILTIQVAYAWGMAYGLFSALFFPRAFDPEGGMSQQRR